MSLHPPGWRFRALGLPSPASSSFWSCGTSSGQQQTLGLWRAFFGGALHQGDIGSSQPSCPAIAVALVQGQFLTARLV